MQDLGEDSTVYYIHDYTYQRCRVDESTTVCLITATAHRPSSRVDILYYMLRGP